MNKFKKQRTTVLPLFYAMKKACFYPEEKLFLAEKCKYCKLNAGIKSGEN
jgi:hypothetical protein